MKERNCPYCGELFIPEHLNRKYCTEDCYKERKKERTRERYAQMQRYMPIKQNDDILHVLYTTVGGIVKKALLVDSGFQETYYLRTRKINGTTMLELGRYGLTVHSNTEFRIHKLQ